ncbi:hypothetical protein BDN72DRAFT_517568 [Pluteus cervinus]|uniref:Uncharacterized protein n=1 Tax=Pluteus cervinus TaxID=181527 RepID=A0ACD3BC50_9AGAR|nr:hypothetical protein BDN72DRAFT_517568 [Pluteus cervinus]
MGKAHHCKARTRRELQRPSCAVHLAVDANLCSFISSCNLGVQPCSHRRMTILQLRFTSYERWQQIHSSMHNSCLDDLGNLEPRAPLRLIIIHLLTSWYCKDLIGVLSFDVPVGVSNLGLRTVPVGDESLGQVTERHLSKTFTVRASGLGPEIAEYIEAIREVYACKWGKLNTLASNIKPP